MHSANIGNLAQCLLRILQTIGLQSMQRTLHHMKQHHWSCDRAIDDCFNRCIRLAKKVYFEEKVDMSNDPKKAWNAIFDALGKSRKKNSNIDIINIDNSDCSDPQLIADHLNSFFF